jgi:hypothetical protein
MIVIIVAIIACVLFVLMSIFQLLLALGLSLGRLTYGGKYEKLPKNLRIVSLIAVGIFVFTIIIVLERAGLITIFNNTLLTAIVIWILGGYSPLNTIMNAVSKSQWEKRIMTPISLTIAVCCFIVAILA